MNEEVTSILWRTKGFGLGESARLDLVETKSRVRIENRTERRCPLRLTPKDRATGIGDRAGVIGERRVDDSSGMDSK